MLSSPPGCRIPMPYFLLGTLFKEGEQYPPAPPELAIDVGWWVFGCAALLLAYAGLRASSLRRALFALEDPRTYAVLRIGFAVMTIVCFWNLYPYWRMLWSDEGIFDLEYAEDRLGRTALRGWSPEEGFFDVWAVICFLWNKPSLFYMYGSPDFVMGYMIAFFAVLVLYGAGVFSRVTGIVAWLMMSGIYNRNSLYWEGTDTVYRCFWFILLFAKTGHAWSFDNWWRCRRAARRGRPEAPRYRRVPAWPRYLMMLQLVAVYVTTGWVKTGNVWKDGDALYYALNMDHFYRFEYVTQWVSSVFGLNLFRLNTWVVHWWESLFALVFVGVVLRFGLRHADEPWYRAQQVPWRKWLGRAALVAAYALIYRIIVVSTPFCLPLRGGKPVDATGIVRGIHVAFGVVIPLLVAAWFVLGRYPRTLFADRPALGDVFAKIRRREHASAPPRNRILRTLAALRLPAIPIDRETMRIALFGRRVWLSIGVIFHGFLILFMNIGMFPFIMLMTYAAYVEGEEFNRFFARVVRRLRPNASDRYFAPAQAVEDIPVKGRVVPDAVVFAFGAVGLGLVWLRIEKVTWVETATHGWLGAMLVVAIVFRLLPTRPCEPRGRPPLAYGAVGRGLAFALALWHVGAVASHLFPSYPLFAKWRSQLRPFFGTWLQGTGTTQSWQMFSPNPPRSNVFMKTVVVLESGERWDLRNNAFHYRSKASLPSRPNPWIVNDRMRKMQRRMVDKGKWYLSHWAAFHCRDWALQHGEVPVEIQVRKIVTRIPPPTYVSFWVPEAHKGRKDKSTGAISGRPYDPRKLKVHESEVQTHKCEPKGKIPPFMKERYGIPLEAEDHAALASAEQKRTRLYAGRRDAWEKRRDFGRWWAFERERAQRQAENEARRKAAQERAAASSPGTNAPKGEAR